MPRLPPRRAARARDHWPGTERRIVARGERGATSCTEQRFLPARRRPGGKQRIAEGRRPFSLHARLQSSRPRCRGLLPAARVRRGARLQRPTGFTVVACRTPRCAKLRRARAAILSSGLTWPCGRVTINLAPTGVRKGGAGLDLAIAVGLLVATGELSPACTGGSRLLRGTGAQRIAAPRAGHARPGRCRRCGRPGRAFMRRPRGRPRPGPRRPRRGLPRRVLAFLRGTADWRTHPSRGGECPSRMRPIWPMSAGRRSAGVPWRWRLRDVTTC